MKAVVQRVVNACVNVNDLVKGKIEKGLLIYLGVARDDSASDADKLAEKIINLRIFDDEQGKMNLSLVDIAAKNPEAGVLTVSQFTLLADTKKGRRPSWNGAALPDMAKMLYEYFMDVIKKHGFISEGGEFQTHMMVSLTNDGPVTIILDSKDM